MKGDVAILSCANLRTEIDKQVVRLTNAVAAHDLDALGPLEQELSALLDEAFRRCHKHQPVGLR